MSSALLKRSLACAALCAAVLLAAAPVTRADEPREDAAAAAAERFSERLELEIERAKLAAELARLGKLPGAIITEDAILFVDGAEIPIDWLEWVDPVQARRARRAARTDTVLRVAPGITLALNNMIGDIRVVTWDRDEVRIEAEHDRNDELVTELRNAVLKLGVSSRHPSRAEVEWKLTVPAWLPVTISGIESEIELSGLRNIVRAHTVRGDVIVASCQGPIEANSVEGEVRVTDVSGSVTAGSINNIVKLVRVVGPVEAQTINGDIQMEKVESVDVDASTVNGKVYYASGYRPRGRYTFSSHNGKVIVPVPKNQNVNVTLSSFQGQIESSMRVPKPAPRAKGRSMHAMRFKIRDGAWTPAGPELTAPRPPRAPRAPRAGVAPPATPELELESFGGLIRLASQEEVLTLLTNQRSLVAGARAQRAHARKAATDARRQARAHRHAPDDTPTPETPPPPPPPQD